METKTPRKRVESLLRIHGGHCFIVSSCADSTALEAAAREMEGEGLCKVTVSHGTIAGINVKKKGFRIRPMGADYLETPTH